MAATPAHYIRTIHTSFTAAHPHSSSAAAWATSSQYLNHHHHHQRSAAAAAAPQSPYTSISTHNTHMYTHHLRDLTHSHSPRQQQGSVSSQQQQQPMLMTQQGQYIPVANPRKGIPSSATSMNTTTTSDNGFPPPTRSAPSPPPHRTRRRSASIRMPPTYKFDPFADEPITPVLSLAATTTTTTTTPEVASEQVEVQMQRHEPLYTIQIPAAAQTDIQLYTTPATPRLAAATLPPARAAPQPMYSSSPSPSSPTPTSAATPSQTPTRALSPRAASFTPMRKANTSPPPNLSKVVANILLNRVHAVGRPMRRRGGMPGGPGRGAQGQGYVKSCLSSVVSVEA